jgi:hypothetical protein
MFGRSRRNLEPRAANLDISSLLEGTDSNESPRSSSPTKKDEASNAPAASRAPSPRHHSHAITAPSSSGVSPPPQLAAPPQPLPETAPGKPGLEADSGGSQVSPTSKGSQRPGSSGSAKHSMAAMTKPPLVAAKRQSKWSAEEDKLIIELRQSGMKWDDISKHLPGRSAISCRLHYQNYLERRGDWDEERKNKLARLYERLATPVFSPSQPSSKPG